VSNRLLCLTAAVVVRIVGLVTASGSVRFEPAYLSHAACPGIARVRRAISCRTFEPQRLWMQRRP